MLLFLSIIGLLFAVISLIISMGDLWLSDFFNRGFDKNESITGAWLFFLAIFFIIFIVINFFIKK